MIDDMLRQNWSTLYSHSIDLKFQHWLGHRSHSDCPAAFLPNIR